MFSFPAEFIQSLDCLWTTQPLKEHIYWAFLYFNLKHSYNTVYNIANNILIQFDLSSLRRKCGNTRDVQWKWRCTRALWHFPISDDKYFCSILQSDWTVDGIFTSQCECYFITVSRKGNTVICYICVIWVYGGSVVRLLLWVPVCSDNTWAVSTKTCECWHYIDII